jgi:hypothetical protein
MELEEALRFLQTSTQFNSVIYFEIALDQEGDLEKISEAAQAIGWMAEVNRPETTVRIFRPRTRARDRN